MPQPGWRGLVGGIWTVDRSMLAPVAGLRAAIGLAVPLLIGVLASRPGDGVAAAAGALSVGYASFQGVYRTRAWAMILASLGMGLATFVGAVVNPVTLLAIPALALCGFGSGLLVAVGPAAAVVGVQWTVAFIIVTQFAMSPADALARAGLVVLGGVGQTLLVVAVWPLRLQRAERAAVAAAYRGLAAYAHGLPLDDPSLLPDGAALVAATKILDDPNPLATGGSTLRLRQLLDEAERIRVELTALAAVRRRLTHPVTDRERLVVDGVLAAAADVLDEVTAELDRHFQRPRALPLSAALDRLTDPVEGLQGGPRAVSPEIVRAGRALAGQLRSTVRIAAGLETDTDPGADLRPRRSAARRPAVAIRSPLLTLRSALSLSSEAFRHALRLGLTLAVAASIYRTLPIQRGYWMALTVLLVLKPDFRTTVSGGLSRLVGTAAGSVLATVVAAELVPGGLGLVALVAVFAVLSYTTFRANYAVFAASSTALIVFLLAVVGLPTAGTAVDRLVDTVAGGVLALAAYAVWPTWEQAVVGRKLADLLAAQRAYGTAGLLAFVDPDRRDPDALHTLLVRARLARTNAQASVARATAEPHPMAPSPDVVGGLTAAVGRYAQAAVTLHANLPGPGGPAMVRVRSVAEQLGAALDAVAAALRTGRQVPAIDGLRDEQIALRDSLDRSDPAARVVITETDAMVDAVNTIVDLMRRPRPSELRRSDP